jgi:ABC-type multidrug transport system fused ATPase/permease subunit
MALISLITVLVFAIILGLMMKRVRYHAQMKFKYVADSITIAEETLSSIRTVRVFNQEETETERFTIPVKKSSDHETILGYLISLMIFLIFGFM